MQLPEALKTADRPTTEARFGLLGRRFGRLWRRFLLSDGRRSGRRWIVAVALDLGPHLAQTACVLDRDNVWCVVVGANDVIAHLTHDIKHFELNAIFKPTLANVAAFCDGAVLMFVCSSVCSSVCRL